MEVEFLEIFSKDLDAVRSADVKKKIAKVIVQVEEAERISAINNLKKMKGHTHAYRIRIGDYRVGLFIEDTSCNTPASHIAKKFIVNFHSFALSIIPSCPTPSSL